MKRAHILAFVEINNTALEVVEAADADDMRALTRAIKALKKTLVKHEDVVTEAVDSLDR